MTNQQEQRDCVMCEEPIDPKRVKALPNCRVCLECQQKRENSGSFRRSKMEVVQELRAWEVESLNNVLIKGE